MPRARLRELGITIGNLAPGPYNTITDVPGVWVGHCTLIYDQPRTARTGVTVVSPRAGLIWNDHAFAAIHAFNGNGEMTGAHWIAESGILRSPIGLTNTYQVGVVRDAFIAYAHQTPDIIPYGLPVVAETYDAWLNDITAFHVTEAHVYQALESASGGPVAEGNVGAGTGTICHEFKGGVGTSSRVTETRSGRYTVGVLVQTNHGDRRLLRVDGVPVGQEIGPERVPVPYGEPLSCSSIIVVIATDAPLLPVQCKRLAQRATVGTALVGNIGCNGSGDIFLAFATGNHVPADPAGPVDLKMIPHEHLNPLFEGVVEATAEAILNSLTAAETMTGFKGHTAHAIPLDELQRVMQKYRPTPRQ
jgi:D-aminopeptidase